MLFLNVGDLVNPVAIVNSLGSVTNFLKILFERILILRMMILGWKTREEEEEDRSCQASHAVQPSIRQRGCNIRSQEGPQLQHPVKVWR